MAIRLARGTRRWILAALSLLSACYAAVLTPGSPCTDSAHCPDGQECLAGSCGGPLGGQTGAPVDAPSVSADAAGEPPGDAALADSCHSSDKCINAVTLGTVSGDTAHDTLAAKGSRAAWFRIRVTENDDSFAGVPMHVLARLTPPPGADFDVVLYVNPDSDVVECTNSFGTPSASGNVKQVRASWGEDVVTDAEDDSRDVSIEIRPKSTTCSDGAQWQLAIDGNWN